MSETSPSVSSLPLEITETDLIKFSSSSTGATWLDVNTNYGLNPSALLLPDIQAINNSLMNLFSCPIGSRGRTFQPTYGTYLYQALQEPLDDLTTNKVRASLIQSIEYWEPRIQLDYGNTEVIAVPSLPGYLIRLAYYYRVTSQYVTTTFKVAA